MNRVKTKKTTTDTTNNTSFDYLHNYLGLFQSLFDGTAQDCDRKGGERVGGDMQQRARGWNRTGVAAHSSTFYIHEAHY